MRKIICFLLVLMFISIFIFILNIKNIEIKIKEINSKYKYQINVDYPKTKYKKLNNKIIKELNQYIKYFKKDMKYINGKINRYYSLDIFYKEYKYNNYLSYKFIFATYTGGAHNNYDILTIVYNKDTNKFITIESLKKLNPNILELFKDISRKDLLYNQNIETSFIMSGTEAKLCNFSNFILTKKGIVLIFPPYQVAPYSYGEINVTIPYTNIKLN